MAIAVVEVFVSLQMSADFILPIHYDIFN